MAPDHPVCHTPSVAGAVEAFFANRDLAAETCRTYRKALDLLVEGLGGDCSVTDLDADRVAAVFAELWVGVLRRLGTPGGLRCGCCIRNGFGFPPSSTSVTSVGVSCSTCRRPGTERSRVRGVGRTLRVPALTVCRARLHRSDHMATSLKDSNVELREAVENWL